MGVTLIVIVGGLIFVAIVGFASAVRIINEYERGVLFRLGRLLPMKGPGLRFIIPFGVARLVKVDLRTVTLEVQAQEVITLDNVTVKVNAVIYYRVVNADHAITRVLSYNNATSQIAQTTLRSVLGQSSLDELLANREKINATLQRIIDEQTELWGIKLSAVEVKDVELPQTMQRAMAQQAEAEREKRAKIIHAQGEFAAQQLTDAATVIATQPNALQLRYLQTLTEIGVERNTVIVFPVPIALGPAPDGARVEAPPFQAPGGPMAAKLPVEDQPATQPGIEEPQPSSQADEATAGSRPTGELS